MTPDVGSLLRDLVLVSAKERKRIATEVNDTEVKDESVAKKLNNMLITTQNYRWIWSKIGTQKELSAQTLTSIFNAFRNVQRLPPERIEYLYKVLGRRSS